MSDKLNAPLALPDLRDDGALLQRFMAKVRVEPETGVWRWTGALGHRGYGRFKVLGRVVVAHRAAWALFRGALPSDRTVNHLPPGPGLDPQRDDVNPWHLELLSLEENARDGTARQWDMSKRTVEGTCPTCGGPQVRYKQKYVCLHCGRKESDTNGIVEAG